MNTRMQFRSLQKPRKSSIRIGTPFSLEQSPSSDMLCTSR